MHSKTVLIFVQSRGMICAKRTTGLEIFLFHLMELLGDRGDVLSLFDVVEDSVNLGAILCHGLC